MISIDRNLNPVIDTGDINNFINQLKPLEIEALWEVITEHEQIQQKVTSLRNISILLQDAEDYLDGVREAHSRLSKQVETLEKELNK